MPGDGRLVPDSDNTTSSAPHDLTPDEKVRFAKEMLTGFRYCRLAMGLYLRGLDPEQKQIVGRWPSQMAELKQMQDVAGFEGFEVEYWSPPPAWKSCNTYYEGTLKDVNNMTFVKEFGEACVKDIDYLQENGLKVVWWGMQNEPNFDYANVTPAQCAAERQHKLQRYELQLQHEPQQQEQQQQQQQKRLIKRLENDDEEEEHKVGKGNGGAHRQVKHNAVLSTAKPKTFSRDNNNNNNDNNNDNGNNNDNIVNDNNNDNNNNNININIYNSFISPTTTNNRSSGNNPKGNKIKSSGMNESYAMCDYTQCSYYTTFRVVAPMIKKAFPGMLIHANSARGQAGASAIANDDEAASYVDAWTWHFAGDRSVPVRNQSWLLSGARGKPIFVNEFEYQPDTPFFGKPTGTLNLAQLILNFFTYTDSPSFYWIHALKPTTNMEAEGYAMGFWRPRADQNTSHYPDLDYGHWMYYAPIYHALAGFAKIMPWNSVRYDVAEATVNDDARIMAFKTPSDTLTHGAGGPLHAFVTPPDRIGVVLAYGRDVNNATGASFTYTLGFDDGRPHTLNGYRFTSDDSGYNISLGSVTVPASGYADITVPPLSIEFWIEW